MNEFQNKLSSDPSKRKSLSEQHDESRKSWLNGRRPEEKEHERKSNRSKRFSSTDSARSYEPPWPEQSYIDDRRVYLELMVVVDKEMEDYYGANLENHVLTIMFMVSEMTSLPDLPLLDSGNLKLLPSPRRLKCINIRAS